MNIRRVIPGVRHELRHGHASPAREIEPALPVTEVRESHDALLTDAQHLVDQVVGLAESLQSLRQ